jgi:hypothetical protein
MLYAPSLSFQQLVRWSRLAGAGGQNYEGALSQPPMRSRPPGSRARWSGHSPGRQIGDKAPSQLRKGSDPGLRAPPHHRSYVTPALRQRVPGADPQCPPAAAGSGAQRPVAKRPIANVSRHCRRRLWCPLVRPARSTSSTSARPVNSVTSVCNAALSVSSSAAGLDLAAAARTATNPSLTRTWSRLRHRPRYDLAAVWVGPFSGANLGPLSREIYSA